VKNLTGELLFYRRRKNSLLKAILQEIRKRKKMENLLERECPMLSLFLRILLLKTRRKLKICRKGSAREVISWILKMRDKIKFKRSRRSRSTLSTDRKPSFHLPILFSKRNSSPRRLSGQVSLKNLSILKNQK